MVETAKEAQDLTHDVAEKRKQRLENNFPQLNRDNFSSEEMYREALLTQYRQLRQQEYQYICLSEGTAAFDVAVQHNGNMNYTIFGKQLINSDSLAYQKIARGDIVNNPSRYRGKFCCAASACAIEAAICERMNVENLVKCNINNLSARSLAPFDENLKISGKGKNELWQLIEEGKVGPGDQISRDSTGNSNSGRHSEVIVAVNYDEDGNLKNYVIQGNNKSKLQVIDANTPYPPDVALRGKIGRQVIRNGKKVMKLGSFTVGCMNTWMGEQLDREAENIRTLPIAELESKVALQKDSTVTEIEDLEKTEQHLFGLRTGSDSLRKIIDNYAATYIRNSGIPEATSLAMEIDAQNAKGEEQRQTDLLRQQTADHEEKPSKTLINPELLIHKTNQYQ